MSEQQPEAPAVPGDDQWVQFTHGRESLADYEPASEEKTPATPPAPVAAIRDEWIDAALTADARWMRSARAVVFVSPAREQVRVMLEAAAPLIAAAAQERSEEKGPDHFAALRRQGNRVAGALPRS